MHSTKNGAKPECQQAPASEGSKAVMNRATHVEPVREDGDFGTVVQRPRLSIKKEKEIQIIKDLIR